MPCLRKRSLLWLELDTTPAMRSFRPASASMKWFTVEPVPTPTTRPGTTYCNAACPTRALSSSCVIGARTPLRQSPIMALVPYALTRPFLFGLDAEHAHELTLASIATLQNTPAQCLFSQPRVDDALTLAGLKFPNRVGLAAVLDKNGRCIDVFGAMG